MPTPHDPSSPQIKSPSENARWRKAHLNLDRSILQATLPLALVRECDQEAERLGLSRAAYVAGCLSLAAEFSDQIALRVRLLERQHGVRFRSPGSPASNQQGSPCPLSKVSP